MTQEAVEVMEAKQIALARVDPDSFMEYVLRDEATGLQVRQTEVQSEWHRLAKEHDRLLIWSHIESGKTMQMSVGRTLWMLGRNPNLRICIASNTHGQAAKIVRTIGNYIENSYELHQVFPNLKPDRPWTTTQLFVERTIVAKDPSVQATGFRGNITGARIDVLVMDDMLDPENTHSPAARDELWNWYQATLSGRLTANAKVIIVGTAYHPEDFLHRMAQIPGWQAKRFPAVNEDGTPKWPQRWPASRLARKRLEIGPLEYARQMMCQARDDTEARFKREWIERCLRRGAGKSMCKSLNAVPAGYRLFTGVDLAVQKSSAADSTVFFTIVVHPNGDREVINIESGKWSGPDIVNRILQARRCFPGIVRVENNASQDFLLHFVRQAGGGDWLQAHTTGRSKASPEFGVESIATEMFNGRWIIPSANGTLEPEIAAWVQEMLYYQPDAHTGDRLMASWFAREAARATSYRAERFTLDVTSR